MIAALERYAPHVLAGALWMFQQIPREYAPKEDRGTFSVLVNGP